MHSMTLHCPCSNKTISQDIFMSFAPTLHQICSSAFLEYQWIYGLQNLATSANQNSWIRGAPTQFQLLDSICDLVNNTVNNAVYTFLSQVFIASSIMNETDFNTQINASVNQFYQSMFYNFNIQKEILYLIIRVNQLYMAIQSTGVQNAYVNLILKTINVPNNYTIGNVC